MTYTPVSLAYAERLILDYSTMRAIAATPDAANFWLRNKLATLHTQAMELEKLKEESRAVFTLAPDSGHDMVAG